MFSGPFRSTLVAMGGLLWKRPWRMSKFQKYRLRERMRQVDSNIEALYEGLKSQDLQVKKVENLMANFPKESEMKPRDKYTVFNKSSQKYRKGVHLVPKWTKLSLRENPKYF
ncbi:unnamed protein product [Kuraishia capsulata CBS 1993]|uniref:Large ribosomal subunit protein mL60 n=1 Tax=Kuraishia capsulata CBS 1993 TaxID=1382522 RepID=W6MGL2_9ASCO|nr:uncharacterized protein KUCA_T00000639001 [Kuraishia capsulata CBS 1993]CDK24673.1 unnamed protein product [Kuraishia capsulata CBS 1993]